MSVGPESNFYKKIKKKWKSISFIRIENRAYLALLIASVKILEVHFSR